MQYGELDTSYKAAGELEGIQTLVDSFYHYMSNLEEAKHIRAMHKDNLTEARKRLSYFLSAWLGGPRLYSENYGSISIPSFHAAFPINQQDSEAWLLCMKKAIDDQPYEQAFKSYLLTQLALPASRIVAVQQ